ncbi:MAG: GAF domain-containing protein [Chloroflexi bacterium]|nr:GAF domain-containing protein [Chloroflexota bacterium]
MPQKYAARYTLIAMLIAIVFVIAHATLDLLEIGLPVTLESYRLTLGVGDLLVMTTPFSFSLLAYLAGRQRDRVDAQRRYFGAINQLNRTLTRALDLDQTLPEALAQIAAALGLDHAALYLFDRDQLTLSATTPDLPDVLVALMEHGQLEQWLPALLPRTPDQALVTLDLTDDPVVPIDLRRSDYRGLVSVLLVAEGRNLGLLLATSRRPAHLSAEQTSFLLATSSQIGTAVARVKPYAELKRRARDLDAIAQVNRTLLAGMGLDDLLDMIVNAAQVRFGLPYVAVLWVDEAANEFVVRAQAGPLAANAPLGLRLKLTQGLSAHVYRTGQSYLARDVRSESEFIPASDAPVLSSLLVPMKASGRVLGIMAFDSLGLDAFTEADVAALTTLTDQMTIAAENARLYAEAQRERRRSAAILRSTRDVVVLIGPDQLVQLLNPAAERVLEVTTETGSDQLLDKMLKEPALREAYQWLSSRSLDEDSPPREVMLGSNAVYAVTLTTARDEAGQFFGRVLVMQDITYLKQLDQFRTQMIQMASHDLRNPLGVAMGYLELLTDDLKPLTPLRRQVLTGLGHALTRMQNLVTDLLDMERIEAGADRRREPVQLNALAQTIVDELREQAEAKQQTLEAAIAPEVPAVTGDPIRLKQALINLIGNAIKYTPDRGHIWVRLHPGKHQLVFEVQDTGYGMSAAAQAKLFQRFFRAKTRGTEHIDGTGLGLSLVKAVIEQHGGRISVTSEEGQGSTFRVELPIVDDQ